MSIPLRVLIVEDSEDDSQLLVLELRRGGYTPTTQRVETPDALRSALASQSWDLVISDYTLPRFSAPDALALLHECGLDLPFLIVSGTVSEETAVAAMKAGAHDLITKNRLARLIPAIARELREAEVRQARRQEQATRREREASFRLLFANNPHPMWVYDLGTLHFLEVNDAAVHAYGYSRNEFLRMRITDIRPPEDVPRLLEDIQQARPSLSPACTWRHRLKDGRLIDVEIASHTLEFAGRRTVLVVAHDVTERRRAEAALRASEERLKTTMDSMLEGGQIIGFDWRYLYVNDAVAAQGQKAREELLGHTMMQAYPGIEHTEVFATLRHCMEQRVAQRLENEFTFPDGSIGWFDLNIQPVPEGVFILSHDITDRKRAESRILRQLERLGALRAIDMAITSSLNLRETLAVVLEQVTTQLGVDAADVLLLEPNTRMLAYAAGRGFRTSALQQVPQRLGEGNGGRAALERRIVNVPDLREAGRQFRRTSLLVGDNFVSYFGAPLIAKGEVKGVLEIFHRAPLKPDPEWQSFLEALAGQAAIAVDNAQLFASLQRTNTELTHSYDATIEGWSRALDLRDKETKGHSQRVTEWTLRLARALGLSEVELVHVRRGALLHDLGKLGIPDGILLKPGKLTDEEWMIMRKHPTYAYEMLSPITYLRPALDIPYCHHEKWDGSGYPRGLKGEQIPRAARIFAVVDVWDALRSDRPYRQAWPEEKVCEHIRSMSGSHFDPDVVEVFLNMIDKGC